MKILSNLSTNHSKKTRPKKDINFVIIHYTGMQSEIESIKRLKSPKHKVSCHYLINRKGKNSVDYYHKKLGKIMWNKCGMSRNKNELKEAINEIKNLREDFHQNVKIPGELDEFNEELSKATRVSDFLELGELFAKDALEREESCGGHFREEHQTKEGEALRNDKDYKYVSAWEFNKEPRKSLLHKEKLEYEEIEVKTRSYK